MASALIGALRVTLGLDSAQFETGANRAIRNMSRMERAGFVTGRAIKGLAGAAATLGVALLGAFSVQAIKGSLDYAASLGEVSSAAGVTVEQLQVYRLLATQVNLSQEQMDKSLTRLTLSIGKAASGAKAQKDAFAALNISLTDSQGKTRATGDVMLDLAERIASIPDPAKQAAAAFAIFGKQGQQLIPLLAMGRKGIEEYAAEMEKAGVIIGTDLSNSADRAADKMALLNAQLHSRFAKVVAENSGAILAFANALSIAAVQLVNFITKYGRLIAVIGGAAIGGRLAGLPGAAVGGVAGFLGGGALARGAANSNSDLDFRRAELAKAQQRFNELQKLGGRGVGDAQSGPFKAAVAELKKQTGLTVAATAELRAARAVAAQATGNFDPGEFLDTTGGKGGGKGGKAARDRTDEITRQFNADLSDLQQDQLRVQAALADSFEARLDFEKDSLVKERDQRLADIANNADFSVQQKKALSDIIFELYGQEAQLNEQGEIIVAAKPGLLAIQIEREREQRLLENKNALLEIEFGAQSDALEIQKDLADNQAERKRLALEILELEYRHRKAILEAAILAENDVDERKKLQARLASLDANIAGQRAAVARQNETPREQFLRDINSSAGRLSEKFDQITIDGLNALNDGLVDAIVNFKSLGDVASSVLRQVLADLLRLQIQKAIIGPLASVLGLTTGSSIGGDTGGLFRNFDAVFGGARAFGGPVLSGRTYLVGERGPELFTAPMNGDIISNDNSGWNRNVTHSPTFIFPGISNPRDAREAAGQAARRYRQELTPMRGM